VINIQIEEDVYVECLVFDSLTTNLNVSSNFN